MKNMKIAAGAAAALLLLGACGGSSDGPAEATGSSTSTDAVDSEPTEADGGSGSDSTGSEAEVTLQTFRFEPGDIEVEAGTTVSWTNNDDILHTVTSGIGQEQGVPGVSQDKDAKPDGMFDQEMDSVGSTFEFTFEKAGTFDYYCAIHPGMTGKVTVR